MEATSIYGEALAEFLYGEGFQVSIVNPARIKGFAKSELLRTKTDSVDAALIARFCAAMKPSFSFVLYRQCPTTKSLVFACGSGNASQSVTQGDE